MTVTAANEFTKSDKTGPPGATENAVFIEFESLRGIAAMLVVFNHVPAWNVQLYTIPFVRYSGLMVDLFFVLSGFIIYTAYSQRLRSGRDLAGFMAYRFARLYPLHLATLLFFAVIELVRQNSASLGVARANAGLYQDATLGVFFEHLFLVQAIPPFHDVLTFNSPSWSIGVEFYTYLIFGTVVLLLGAGARRFFAILAVCGVLLLAADVWPLAQWFLRGVTGFAIGTLVGAWWAQRNLAPSQAVHGAPAWHTEVLLVSIFAVVAAAQWLPKSLPGLLVMALTAAYVISALRRRSGPVGPLARMMRTRPLQWLGTLSFTYYLLHGPVLWVTNNLARYALKWPQALVAGTYKPQASLAAAGLWTLASIVLMLVLSYLVWRFYEVPAREAIRRWAQRRIAAEGVATRPSA